MNFTFENREEILDLINNKQLTVKFAVECAKLVSHLSNNPKIEAAIKTIENWIANPSEENRDAYAAYAAYAAANAAAAAAYNAADAVRADLNIKPKIVKLLKEIYLESLPEDERNCWLVQTTIGV